ncbi:MAG: dUTP diphosphatase [Pseudomonas sp.]|nr:dUTP diphosphatase [Pseudomonas sp.]
MEIIKLHPDLLEPKRGTDGAAGYDLFMPSEGASMGNPTNLVGLGFAAKVPAGFVALILPRSSAGVKLGVRLGNTVGVIDSDYEGEWKVNIRTAPGDVVQWSAGDRLFQFVVMPVGTPELVFVDKFSTTSERGAGGFGSTNV